MSVGGANQMLHSFASLGWLLEEKRGRMLFYRANNEDPTVRQLKVLFTLFSLEDLIKQAKPLSQRLILFGSSANGTDGKESDIDLFLLTDDKKEVSDVVHKFNAKSQKRVAPIILDTQGFSRLRREDSAIFDRISKGIVLWQKD